MVENQETGLAFLNVNRTINTISYYFEGLLLSFIMLRQKILKENKTLVFVKKKKRHNKKQNILFLKKFM